MVSRLQPRVSNDSLHVAINYQYEKVEILQNFPIII